jgi:hypothetical protein
MALGYVTLLRNAMLNQIATFADAGAGAAKLRIYDGVQPATGGAATVLLAELVMSDPAFAAAAAGVLTANAIADDISADAAGTATWMRVVDSNNVVVYDGTVGLAAADLILNSVTFSIGLNVAVTSLAITEGNP